MTIPDFQTLMLPVLEASQHGEVRIGELVEKLADQASPCPMKSGRRCFPSGRQTTFANRTHWAKSYLTKAGLLEATGRGRSVITETVRAVRQKGQSKSISNCLNNFLVLWRFGRVRKSMTSRPLLWNMRSQNALTPDESMRAAHQLLETQLGNDLLDRILAAPPDFFERLVVKLLTAMGYGRSTGRRCARSWKIGRRRGRWRDHQDALGLDRIYVQAKRYARDNSVGPSAIRDFFGSLDRFKAAKGLFVTTSNFTTSARETAEFLSKRIVLVEGAQLAKLMIRHEVGCRIEETLYIKRIDEEFFE